MDRKTIKQLGVWGVIAFVLSLPVMIWKSSKVGRRVSLVLLLVIILVFSGKFFDKGIGFYKMSKMTEYTINEHKVVVGFYEDIAKSVLEIDDGLLITIRHLTEFEKVLNRAIQEKIVEVDRELRNKLDEDAIEIRIREIELAIDLVKGRERDALKEKIINIRELVKLHDKSIESAEIRLIIEKVSERMYLLDGKEKERMFNDLKEIGFTLERVSDEITNIVAYSEEALRHGRYEQSYSYATADSIAPWGWNQYRAVNINIINQ